MEKVNISWLEDAIKQERLDEVKTDLRETLVTVVPSCANSKTTLLSTFGFLIDNMSELEEVHKFQSMRGWKHCGDQEKESKFKKLKAETIPAFTLSTYGEAGCDIRKLGHAPKNPYIIIDIDFNSVEDANEEVFNKINSLPFVVGSTTSISGMGFWSIVKLNIDRVKSSEDWKTLYKELIGVYEDEDIEIDKACSNINRLRVFSPYKFVWNENYERPYDPMLKSTKKEKEDLEICVEEYEVGNFGERAFKETYSSGDMHWKRLNWANTIYNIFGESGEDLYYEIFSDDPQKDGDLTITWEWVERNSKKYPSSSYCLRVLEEKGWIKRKAEEISNDLTKTNNPLLDF